MTNFSRIIEYHKPQGITFKGLKSFPTTTVEEQEKRQGTTFGGTQGFLTSILQAIWSFF